MPSDHHGTNYERSPYFGALQSLVDSLYQVGDSKEEIIAAMVNPPKVRRLDVVLAAEAADLPDDLLRIVRLLPPGDYTRDRLCVQLNSAISGHAWGQVYGTVA